MSLHNCFSKLNLKQVLASLSVVCHGFGLQMEPIFKWSLWVDIVSICIIPHQRNAGRFVLALDHEKGKDSGRGQQGSTSTPRTLWHSTGRYLCVPYVPLILAASFCS